MENGVEQEGRIAKQPRLPILSRISLGAKIYALQTVGVFILWYRERNTPNKFPPSTTKTYPCRPSLPIR